MAYLLIEYSGEAFGGEAIYQVKKKIRQKFFFQQYG